MPWLIGIDEAGYGPNLGPLVQTAVRIRTPNHPPGVDLWNLLAAAVRKAAPRVRDERIVVDDSKKVYGPSHSLSKLELGVLATLSGDNPPETVRELLNRIAPNSVIELSTEPWFDEGQPIPIAVDKEELGRASRLFSRAVLESQVSLPQALARITSPSLFNTLVDELGNKSDVLAHGLRWLLRENNDPDAAGTPLFVAIDRQGGRRYHAGLLQASSPDGWIEVVEESERSCVYRQIGARERQWKFEVEADAGNFNVALASMVSKYLREVMMGQFNRWWQSRVPHLKPTAGYPVDAARFFAEIRPMMIELQIDERTVWRSR